MISSDRIRFRIGNIKYKLRKDDHRALFTAPCKQICQTSLNYMSEVMTDKQQKYRIQLEKSNKSTWKNIYKNWRKQKSQLKIKTVSIAQMEQTVIKPNRKN
jgi:hypothetical protein